MRTTVSRATWVIVMAVSSATGVAAQVPEFTVTDADVAARVARTEKEANNPDAFFELAVAYWYRVCLPRAKPCEPSAVSAAAQAAHVGAGLAAVNKALSLRPDFIEAIAFKQLLLRSQAILEPRRADALLREADDLLDRFAKLNRERTGR